jgi:hypothetical protein
MAKDLKFKLRHYPFFISVAPGGIDGLDAVRANFEKVDGLFDENAL